MDSRRLAALGLLLAVGLAACWLVWTTVAHFPEGLIGVALVVAALYLVWEGIRRRGVRSRVLLGLAALAAAVAALDLIEARLVGGLLVGAALIGFAYWCARTVFKWRVRLPAAVRPKRPVVIWNPMSGGGKALEVNLAQEARSRGIEPIELTDGVDLIELVQKAVADGADALAAAGGDGTQAIVAGIAAEHDLPFACIPAGTRNHFALDLGVDRSDVVGALDAFVDGGERRVDLGVVNGRVFVNNVSMGLYAEAVQREEYRGAKLRTILETAPSLIGVEDQTRELTWIGPGGAEHSNAAIILVSNNSYRIGVRLGAGTRPRMDDGVLGIAVLAGPQQLSPDGESWRVPWRQWTSPSFRVDSQGEVPVGVDGEAMMLSAPLDFGLRPKALRVRIAPHHPGISPSAALPENFLDGLSMIWRIARGDEPEAVFAHRPSVKTASGG